MVIGGLIIIGIVWCIIRCACCGVACCCSCFRCLKCCGNCCGCCDPPGGKPHKYLDEPYNQQGYRTEAPMQAPFPPAAKSVHAPPQYAEFDVSKKDGEDSLPAMPSWEGANSKKIGMEADAVEMEPLKKSPMSASDPKMPLMAGPSPGPVSPMEPPSPYGPPQGAPYGNPHGYAAARGQPMDPYSPQDQGYNNYNSTNPSMHNMNSMNNVGNRESVGFGLDQPYDTEPGVTPAPVPVMAAAAIPGRQSPGPGPNGYGRNPGNQAFAAEMPGSPVPTERPGYDAYGQGNSYNRSNSRGPPRGNSRGPRPPPGPQGYGGMRRQGTGDSVGSRNSPAPYGMDPRMRNSPGPRRTPGPRNDPYGPSSRQSPAPQNDYARSQGYNAPPRDNYGGNRSYSPAPERQYSAELPATSSSRQPAAPESPITNNSGFDFTSGFARPQNEEPRPSKPQQPAQEAYPGFKPYQPAQEGWSGV